MRCCCCGFAAVELDRGLDDLLLLVLLPETVFPGGLGPRRRDLRKIWDTLNLLLSGAGDQGVAGR